MTVDVLFDDNRSKTHQTIVDPIFEVWVLRVRESFLGVGFDHHEIVFLSVPFASGEASF